MAGSRNGPRNFVAGLSALRLSGSGRGAERALMTSLGIGEARARRLIEICATYVPEDSNPAQGEAFRDLPEISVTLATGDGPTDRPVDVRAWTPPPPPMEPVELVARLEERSRPATSWRFVLVACALGALTLIVIHYSLERSRRVIGTSWVYQGETFETITDRLPNEGYSDFVTRHNQRVSDQKAHFPPDSER